MILRSYSLTTIISPNKITNFINVAAHELRGPYTAYIRVSSGSSCKEQQQDDREQKRTENNDDLLSAIIRNARRLQQLTENILTGYHQN